MSGLVSAAIQNSEIRQIKRIIAFDSDQSVEQSAESTADETPGANQGGGINCIIREERKVTCCYGMPIAFAMAAQEWVMQFFKAVCEIKSWNISQKFK